MTFRPTDPDEFFQSLGADRVRKALVNREVSGDLARSARLWLDQYGAAKTRLLSVRGLWVTGAGILIAAGVAIGVALWIDQPSRSVSASTHSPQASADASENSTGKVVGIVPSPSV